MLILCSKNSENSWTA